MKNPVTDSTGFKHFSEWLEFDRKHLWHPYTSLNNALPCYAFDSADGCIIRLASGEQLVDGMSSWWCAIHGYNHPTLNAAAIEQVQRNAHMMFGGMTHEPAVELAQRLLRMGPANLDAVFLADSGSVSVEVAIKMAAQYYQAKGQPGKHRLLALRNGYHGDTAGAMAVCDPVTGMHSLFSKLLPKHLFAPQPQCRFGEAWNPADFTAMRDLLQQHHSELCAVILEPIVQGAGGIWFYHPQYLSELRTLCDELDILLIYDEIATGFGRTGKLFAWEWAQAAPDIMTVGKALTGGYMTLAATLATAKVAQTIGSNGPLMHGPTFMGNPLACAVANASLSLLSDNHWQQQVRGLETEMQQGLMPISQYKSVKDVRVLGAIGAVELHQDVDVAAAQRIFVNNGAWIRPFGKLIYLMPPFIASREQIATLCIAIEAYVQTIE